ncbi:MAG TPA: hypothetical protein VFL82_11065 [Thermomicrobiales bacterium]|nr:hypothetical protein [Thermomicrobiales bacterium]
MRRRTFLTTEDPAIVPGAVLCRDRSVATDSGNVNLRRGVDLTDALARLPKDGQPVRLEIVVPENGEVSQPDASARLAAVIAGPGVIAGPPHQGEVTLKAAHRGVLRVDGRAVSRLNRSPVVMVATSLDGRLVAEGEDVGIVKAPALFVDDAGVEKLEQRLASTSTVRVAPFSVQSAGLIAGDRIRPANLKASAPHMAAALQTFGADLTAVEKVADDPDAIGEVYRRLLADGAGFLLVAGSIVLDPDDPFIRALRAIDGHLVRRGAPIEPGTMFWVAYAGNVPIFGLASCEMYGRLSILNLLLPYAMAREPINRGLMADLGYGGLLQSSFCARQPD